MFLIFYFYFFVILTTSLRADTQQFIPIIGTCLLPAYTVSLLANASETMKRCMHAGDQDNPPIYDRSDLISSCMHTMHFPSVLLIESHTTYRSIPCTWVLGPQSERSTAGPSRSIHTNQLTKCADIIYHKSAYHLFHSYTRSTMLLSLDEFY